jgi:hypothetical protein
MDITRRVIIQIGVTEIMIGITDITIGTMIGISQEGETMVENTKGEMGEAMAEVMEEAVGADNFIKKNR